MPREAQGTNAEAAAKAFTLKFLQGLRGLIEAGGLGVADVAEILQRSPAEVEKMLDAEMPMALTDLARLWLRLREPLRVDRRLVKSGTVSYFVMTVLEVLFSAKERKERVGR